LSVAACDEEGRLCQAVAEDCCADARAAVGELFTNEDARQEGQAKAAVSWGH
jgi:hypothetical protein